VVGVRNWSAVPAARAGRHDRGVLKTGMYADIVLFDPAKVRDRADFKSPHQSAEGFLHVIVNGQTVILDGKLTGARPGRVLYGPAYRR
jgi:N-acyl-D-aspartate/D-glutamate deacylase